MFRGRTDAATFAAAAGWVNALFVGITFAFPFLLYGLLSISGCRSTGGACGALGLVLAIWIKPMIYIAYVLSFLGLAARRLRDAGLPAALAFGLFVLMLSDVQWGMVMGAPWSVGFRHRVRRRPSPILDGGPRLRRRPCRCCRAWRAPRGADAGRRRGGRRSLMSWRNGLIVLMMIVAVASLITDCNDHVRRHRSPGYAHPVRASDVSFIYAARPPCRRGDAARSLSRCAIANGWPWAGPATARRWRRRLPYASPSSPSDPPSALVLGAWSGWRSSWV